MPSSSLPSDSASLPKSFVRAGLWTGPAIKQGYTNMLVAVRSFGARPSMLRRSAPLCVNLMRRSISSASDFDHAAFTDSFLGLVSPDVYTATDPARSASLLRRLVKSEMLKFTDMQCAA